MTRYEDWIKKQTLQAVAERYANDYRCQCECCPIYNNWRICKAYHSGKFLECVHEFAEWLREEVKEEC